MSDGADFSLRSSDSLQLSGPLSRGDNLLIVLGCTACVTTELLDQARDLPFAMAPAGGLPFQRRFSCQCALAIFHRPNPQFLEALELRRLKRSRQYPHPFRTALRGMPSRRYSSSA